MEVLVWYRHYQKSRKREREEEEEEEEKEEEMELKGKIGKEGKRERKMA